MAMTVGKKGMFFTFIAILLVIAIVLYNININRPLQSEQTDNVAIRVLSMDTFISDVEKDVERGLYISSLRSLIGMSEYVAEYGTFLPNFTMQFQEVMLTGNMTSFVNGTAHGTLLNITKNATFQVWIDKIQEKANYLGLKVDITNLTITAYQDNAWMIKVNAYGFLNLTDRKGLAHWERILNVTTAFSILDFEDPLYTIRSEGKFTNKIIRSNYSLEEIRSDKNKLIAFVNYSWYLNSSDAPDYIMRFQGNLTGSPFGLESVVHVVDLESASGINYGVNSTIDYLLFGTLNLKNCVVNETKGVFDWFRLDNANSSHLAKYGVTGVNCT